MYVYYVCGCISTRYTNRLTNQAHLPSPHPQKQDPYSLPALLALGVSYVNELDSVRALQNLKAWVEHNPKYQVNKKMAICPSKITVDKH